MVLDRLAWICRLAVVAAVVGVFGTWRSAGPVSLDGVDGPHDGWLVVIFAAIALAGAGSAARGAWPGVVLLLVCAAAVVYFPLRNLLDDRDTYGGSSGWGIWLTIAAGVVLGAAAVLAAAARVRGRTRAGPRASL